ncbi:copper-resistance protein, CopA family [Thermocrinis albus DSM 14484]|uniref:Copper-resistance protein, CopA family n=1 Tax=Thermocrinis albus (strain DSM 14484 / JCM 11386 / HI 11/12) TaxID=638303 RepID=D3SM51_THEAH|nr:multicopper oxidase domain-containing protein [Thermocrinis albus]ADC89831.1 copper-resistance protein, CopA family [Thermocrinis albus DSM 14484]
MISRRELLLMGLLSPFVSYTGWSYQGARGLYVADVVQKGDKLVYQLVVRKGKVRVGDQWGEFFLPGGTVPGPLLRLKEGMWAHIVIYNETDEPISVHWHGIILPNSMDGVPYLTAPPIPPGGSFKVEFPVQQYGTYFYHSHVGLQEQAGFYGPLIIDPAEREPFSYKREYVVVLSDWTPLSPHKVMALLKKQSNYFQNNRLTLMDLLKDAQQRGLWEALAFRLMWARMRMSPTDILDVTGSTYTYLMNGHTPQENWTAIFKPGERIRLRFINASAMTYFDVRIPGLSMKVVAADGLYVEPVEVDEIRIGVAERYDVIVEPKEEKAYTIIAEAMDRSGYARGTLAPRPGMTGPLPPTRTPPVRTSHSHEHHHHHHHMDPCQDCPVHKGPYPFGPTADMVVQNPVCMLDQVGVGLEDAEHRVLTYQQLRSLQRKDFLTKDPDRVLEVHLTGNMEKFIWRMWVYDGKSWSWDPTHFIKVRRGELVRIVFVNHTMMDHPVHLHGMFMYLRNGYDEYAPAKDTINIKSGEKVCVDVLADAPGYWAFHCHLLYHMHTGMMRVLEVVG